MTSLVVAIAITGFIAMPQSIILFQPLSIFYTLDNGGRMRGGGGGGAMFNYACLLEIASLAFSEDAWAQRRRARDGLFVVAPTRGGHVKR